MILYIKETRTQKGLSLSELAKKSQVSKSYLSEIENGIKTNVSYVVICKLAHALGVRATELFSRE
ncbi:helix-turn-helix domain-containing protein [Maledivibacter halophilus]|uniref:Predicted transcriptional regulators n=1 Tax=Maledivibacter halophilus TaxID=36842 RepID=A0A1T5KDS4_9FIRM|nr:helix-turn-helix transcriptional regulator [Maledivibacter halophilus]SKC61817.1 Predicted transcriptional regulators [Maledivibacter halophilus]